MEFLQNSSTVYATVLPRMALVATATGAVHTARLGEFLDYTLFEIYLSFRTAPIGALGVRGALFETVSLLRGPLVSVALAGYVTGTVLARLLDRYQPGLYSAIGGTLAGMVDRMQTLTEGTRALGLLQLQIEHEFNPPISIQPSFQQSGGDYGAVDELRELYEKAR